MKNKESIPLVDLEEMIENHRAILIQFSYHFRRFTEERNAAEIAVDIEKVHEVLDKDKDTVLTFGQALLYYMSGITNMLNQLEKTREMNRHINGKGSDN